MAFFVDGVEYTLMTREGAWGICCNGCVAEHSHDLCQALGDRCTDMSIVVMTDKPPLLSLKEQSKRHALAALARMTNTPVISIDEQIKVFYRLTDEEVDAMFVALRSRLKLKKLSFIG